MVGEDQKHLERTKEATRQPTKVPATIKQIKQETPTVKSFDLEIDPKENLSFHAGQWVDFFIPAEKVVGGFSITSTPLQLQTAQKLQLAVKYNTHAPSFWLHTKARVGSPVEVRIGGQFYVGEDEAKANSFLLIAGGIGINPLYSILQFVEEVCPPSNDNSLKKVVLLYSCRSEEEFCFRKEIDEIQQRRPDLLTVVYIATGKEGKAEKRLGTSELREAMNRLQGIPRCYLCGPPSMIDSLENTLLTEFSFPKENIRFEKWW